MSFEKLFDGDRIPKRERVERTLDLLPVDRVALHDQLSFNPGVIAMYTGKAIRGFDYTYDDICEVIRRTLDACFPPVAPGGAERVMDADGFVMQHDHWTSWIARRPFDDLQGARRYLLRTTQERHRAEFDAAGARERFRQRMLDLQARIGETVIIDYSVQVGFCHCWSRLGLDYFIYLCHEDPQVISDYIEAFTVSQLKRLHAIASLDLSPVVLIAEDFATKQGPIFGPAFLRRELFPRIRRLTDAWHEHGLKVLYHSDGNWKMVIPDLVSCGLDGFYCLEPSVGMDIVELKSAWPRHVWAGGVDGVDLMERGTPDQVSAEVRRHILDSDALEAGGMFVGTSSEVNPPIDSRNFRSMVETVGSIWNPRFHSNGGGPR